MKKRIIYVGSIYLPDKSAGAQRALSLSKSFYDLGYEVSIVGMTTENISGNILKKKYKYQEFDYFLSRAPKTIIQWIEHTISIKNFIKVIEYYGKENIHSVIAMEYEGIALLRLNKYCFKNNIYLIADSEEWYGKSNLKFPKNIGKDLDTLFRMNYLYKKKIKNMICISRYLEEYYKKNIENIVYVPGTIDKKEKKWRTAKYTPNKKVIFGYAGYPGAKFEKERLDLLIEAVCKLNENGYFCLLKIAGVNEKIIEKKLEFKKEYSNKKDCIIYLGKLEHRKCIKMIASCDFSIIVREDKRVTKAGFPTKLSESFGCGTPVISTKTSNISEYIENGKNGFLCKQCSLKDIYNTLLKAIKLNEEHILKMHHNVIKDERLQYQYYNKVLKKFIKKLNY